jgi:hypothetical protein
LAISPLDDSAGHGQRQKWGDIVEKVAVEQVNVQFEQSCFNHDGNIRMLVRTKVQSMPNIAGKFCWATFSTISGKTGRSASPDHRPPRSAEWWPVPCKGSALFSCSASA